MLDKYIESIFMSVSLYGRDCLGKFEAQPLTSINPIVESINAPRWLDSRFLRYELPASALCNYTCEDMDLTFLNVRS